MDGRRRGGIGSSPPSSRAAALGRDAQSFGSLSPSAQLVGSVAAKAGCLIAAAVASAAVAAAVATAAGAATAVATAAGAARSEEHTSELQSRGHLVCRLLLEKKKNN